MTILLLTIALALPALVFAVWPVVGRRAAADRSGVGPALSDDERAGLENEKLIALRALRELELDRVSGHVGDEDYRELHARYEGDAVAVLRRLDALAPPKPPPRAAPSPAPAATPWTRQPVALGAMGAGLLVFGVVLGLLVSRYSTPAPPEPGMSAAPPGPAAMAPQSGGPPRPLSKEMLQGMLQAAHASLDAGRYQEAIAAYTAILRRDPRNVEAITHLGVILAIAGHHADALEAFNRALAIDPDYVHALWDKAGVQEALQDHAGAVATLERFVRLAPAGPDRDRAQERLREAKARLAAAPKAGAPVVRP
ncbi:MAG TPA: tetratricopeptide repeat protein [Methylomirabilota bacterium]|jgi:tetratricopeptide (TPR) repeat protein